MIGERFITSPMYYAELLRQFDSSRLYPSPAGAPSTFLGVRIETSNLFPMISSCKACHGTGEGEHSTYCSACDGAGRTKVFGMISGGSRTIAMRDKLPPCFAPRFPAGLVAMPPMARGLA